MNTRHLIAALAIGLGSTTALAQGAPVAADTAWARATVQGQKSSGAFVKLTAREALQLVGVASPVAGVAEIHEMKMEGDVMRMRAVPLLNLPAGQAVELKPGGYHVMLMDLRAPLAPNTQIPLTLRFRDARGAESRLELSVPVSAQAPGAAAASGGHGGHVGGHKR